ncbi:hypothetical protein E1161_13355 [Saccharopolyspora aridisoli]|uniref:DUF3168 domain-containing protein n=1 Tax=Saccharopolyspora aridisoli TaxID=2530385 RepID=A0A4V2Y7J2_9PSEU|nr:hypothetical protein [Saccharopolyspora aridisoli]TDC92355.1 hypothetical protein E1161_13355 [Saccharopolyspora aridisoli]
MYSDTRPFPDAEQVVMALLEPLATVVVVSPREISNSLIQIHRAGGADDGVTDIARLETECIACSRHDAWRLAEAVRQRVLNAAASVHAGALIDRTAVEIAPQQVPDDNPDIRRVVATYRLSMRRPLTAGKD